MLRSQTVPLSPQDSHSRLQSSPANLQGAVGREQEASLAVAWASRKQTVAMPGLRAQQSWNSLSFKIWHDNVIYIHIHFEIKEVTGFTVSSLS